MVVWQAAPTRVLLGLAAQDFAGKIGSISHLNLSPDLLASTMELFDAPAESVVTKEWAA